MGKRVVEIMEYGTKLDREGKKVSYSSWTKNVERGSSEIKLQRREVMVGDSSSGICNFWRLII